MNFSEDSSCEAGPVGTVEELIEDIAQVHCVPGWIRHPRPLMWPRPRSSFVPAHWQYSRIRPALVAAGRVIGTDQAERRNFILRNPVEGNDFGTTRTLIGAYQSILPGERARAHRHSPHALRVILESRGSYSVVDGRKHPMETGDIVLTPGGCWHGHGHEGTEQAFWFDCLDIPLVHLLEPMASEEHPQGWEAEVTEEASSAMRFAWADTQQALQAQAASETPGQSRLFGATVELPAPSMPTIGIKVHRMAAGWQGAPYRHSASSIFVVLQGRGTSELGEARFDWAFGDVIAAPMAVPLRHRADKEAVIVELTDEKLMRHCGYYRLELLEAQGGAQ
ncbi:cupin domain-containing protein [Ramlibacter rhizophilus]|uniref:Cupin domain-containing protein n=1 Tax=Ramlibacter rhizophilus TaxID=1781167 RepID=A0A4Z0BMW5_9BURK|nr:cupin domain-containing protein [Ramlibacter rhizophilus]TFY99759.1 cupin domain-containing protein [Ramlibacter rhizophilus]